MAGPRQTPVPVGLCHPFPIVGGKLECVSVWGLGREEAGVRTAVYLSAFPCNLLFKTGCSDFKASCSLFVSPGVHQ